MTIRESGAMRKRLWQGRDSVVLSHLLYSDRLRESILNITWTDWTQNRTPCRVVENFGEIMATYFTPRWCCGNAYRDNEEVSSPPSSWDVDTTLAMKWNFQAVSILTRAGNWTQLFPLPPSTDNINWFLWISMTCARLHLFIVSVFVFDPRFRIKDPPGPRH
jgi:hypothetical protein